MKVSFGKIFGGQGGHAHHAMPSVTHGGMLFPFAIAHLLPTLTLD